MSFSGISSNPSAFGIKLPKKDFKKEDETYKRICEINSVCAMHLIGLPVTIEDVEGFIIGINKKRIRDGKAYYVPKAKHEDFIHIFIPGDYVTKYETLVYVEDDTGYYIPVMIPVCADQPGRNKPYAFRQKLKLNAVNERAVMDFLSRYWADIRRASTYFYMPDEHVKKNYYSSLARYADSVIADPKNNKAEENNYFVKNSPESIRRTEEEFDAYISNVRYLKSPQYKYDYYKNKSDTLESRGIGPEFGFATMSGQDVAAIRAYRKERDRLAAKEERLKNKK